MGFKVSQMPKHSQSTLEQISFSDFPAEILDLIASFLSASAAASFTLSSRTMFLKLGSIYLERINKAQLSVVNDPRMGFEDLPVPTLLGQEREAFLILLSRDIREMIYCYHCKTIHCHERTVDSIFHPNHGQRPCSNVETLPYSQHYFHDNLYFSKVQNLMKQHKYGFDTTSHLKDLSQTCTLYSHKYARHIITEARISDDCLLLRSQYWLVGYDGKLGVTLPGYFELDLCPHLQTRGRNSAVDILSHELDPIITCRQHGRAHKPCSSCSGLHRCDVCATEFQVDRLELGLVNKRPVLVFTVWQDLGECKTPFDMKWQHHKSIGSSMWRPSPHFELGSIKNRFEGNLDSFTPKLSRSGKKSLLATIHGFTIKTPCI